MRIGVFCSGGDAPGMNTCVRAVVRAAVSQGHEVIGIRRGYQGLLDEDFHIDAQGLPKMNMRSVSGWSRVGGAILCSSRSEEFRTEAGQHKAADVLRKHDIQALIPIGGDGTFNGAVALAGHWNGQIIGCPGTIDNDLMGTDFTIGFSTAVQTGVEAVDKLRDTAESHERMFLVEVMGRHSGFIAVYVALASAAEMVCIPETPTDIHGIVAQLHAMRQRRKSSVIMIVAEGDEQGDALKINRDLKQAGCPYSTRVAVLGHIQRGGSPSAEERILATKLGDFAVASVLAGKSGAMAGERGGKLTLTPFAETFRQHKPIPRELLALLTTMSK